MESVNNMLMDGSCVVVGVNFGSRLGKVGKTFFKIRSRFCIEVTLRRHAAGRVVTSGKGLLRPGQHKIRKNEKVIGTPDSNVEMHVHALGYDCGTKRRRHRDIIDAMRRRSKLIRRR